MTIKKPSKKNSSAYSETAQLKEQLLRQQAEFDNYRKRSQAEKEHFTYTATAHLITSILPVLDNFERAATHAPTVDDAAIANWITGIKAIEKQLEEIIVDAGVEKISVASGQLFDHNLHDAVSHEINDLPTSTIIAVTQTGYQYKGKVLRPVKVRVSAGPN